MPALGAITFSIDDGYDSGIAVYLVKPPPEDIAATYLDCQLLASPSTPHAICRFKGTATAEDTFEVGSVLLQQALDMLSILGRGDLVTRDVDIEHLLWWNDGQKKKLYWVSTATSKYQMGTVALTVRDAQGNIVPPIPVVPQHHLGFRFYRLAQASDDLYDAFRNTYLAFESLLSSKFPKGKEQEIDWLRRALQSSVSALSLASLMPPGTTDPVGQILDAIYGGARLPLFHAKDGKTYFAPVASPSERDAVSAALMLLTQLVLRMANVWFSARRRSSWINLSLFEAQDEKIFKESRFIFSDHPQPSLSAGLSDPEIRNGIPFVATFNQHHGGVERHNISGAFPVSRIVSRVLLQAVYLVNDESPLMGWTPDTTLDLEGFDELLVRVFLRGQNGGQPKYLYQR